MDQPKSRHFGILNQTVPTKKAIVSISNENFQLSAAAGILRHVCAQAFKLIMTKGSKF